MIAVGMLNVTPLIPASSPTPVWLLGQENDIVCNSTSTQRVVPLESGYESSIVADVEAFVEAEKPAPAV